MSESVLHGASSIHASESSTETKSSQRKRSTPRIVNDKSGRRAKKPLALPGPVRFSGKHLSPAEKAWDRVQRMSKRERQRVNEQLAAVADEFGPGGP